MAEKYVYDPKNFCIPVTKLEPLEAIQFVIDDFVKKEVTFCIDGDGDRWEIWRIAYEDDRDTIKRKNSPKSPKYVYVKGKKVEFTVKKQ
ncbi:MAG: hypothetical protein DRH57_01125 [Candidatus Cloacimonadota bacterium]|nr:MAG: hypothetical protein DRH57_01125 [Candidatus Cloacimonadota bacterium]